MAGPSPSQGLEGTGETTAQDDAQGVFNVTPKLRKKIEAAAKRLEEIGQKRAVLSAEKRATLESLVADKVSRDTIERAVKDVKKDPAKLAMQDTVYEVVREILGHPIQGALFPEKIEETTTH